MQKKPYLLFISYAEFPPFKGGIAAYITNMIDALYDSYTLFAIAPFSKIKIKEDKRVIKMYRPRITQYSFIKFLLGNINTFFRILTLKPNIIFITDIMSLKLSRFSLSVKYMFFPQTKIYYVMYGTDILDLSTEKTEDLQKLINQKVDTIIVISEYTQKLLSQKLHITVPIHMLYPSITTDFLQIQTTDSKEVVQKFNLQEKLYILSVGRLVKRKGFDKVMKAIQDIPDLLYVIAGEGPEKDFFIKVIKEHTLEDKVKLVGSITDFEKKILLKNCLFYIQPSIEAEETGQRVEGFGISIVEAFSLKKAALVTNHGGMKEIVNNQNGIVVDPDITSIQVGIRKLLDKSMLKQKEVEAYNTYKTNFSPDIFREKLSYILNNE